MFQVGGLLFPCLLTTACILPKELTGVMEYTELWNVIFNASNGGTLGPRTSDHALAQAALHPTNTTHSLSNATTQICRTLHVWPVWLILHGTIPCGFCRLPSPVKNSTYMFRDSCLKQAVQDRQIIITTCT